MHNNIEQNILNYFRAYPDHLWKWADNGLVLEWHSGETICYREDLVSLMRNQSENGFLPLTTILLLLMACKSDFSMNNNDHDLYDRIYSETPGFRTRYQVADAFQFLTNVNGLPEEFKMGKGRDRLLLVMGEEVVYKSEQQDSMLQVFSSGILDVRIFGSTQKQTFEKVSRDIEPLWKAHKKYPSTEALLLKLRTGSNVLPEPLPLTVPTVDSRDLLEQLEDDPKTRGLTELTKRLMAALRIPLHTRGSSDLLFGGVSDISNRGNFDRLLLSELAQEDEMLLARLANNEALYLRREELPDNEEDEKVILLDTTLKMWGMPKLFALAAALAFTQQDKKNTHFRSIALSGKQFQEIDLSHKEGIIHAMELLDPSLDCGKGLQAFLASPFDKKKKEYLLITQEQWTESAGFVALLPQLKQPFHLLATVHLNGHYQLFEFHENRRKHLVEATFDLEELFFKIKERNEKQVFQATKKIWNADKFPLFYPTSKAKLIPATTFQFAKGVVHITKDQRLLFWSDATTAASELIEFVAPSVNYAFGYNGKDSLSLVAFARGEEQHVFTLYHIVFSENKLTTTETDLKNRGTSPSDINFIDGHFYFSTLSDHYKLDPALAEVTRIPAHTLHIPFKSIPDRYKIKKIINNGYAVLNRVGSVGLRQNGDLVLDGRYLHMEGHNTLSWHSDAKDTTGTLPTKASATEVNAFRSGHSEYIRFSTFKWKDGSEAEVDSRGVLRLRSSSKNIPEIVLLLVLEKPTAAWASDGNVCGPYYFTGREDAISAKEFHTKYLKRFVDIIHDIS